MKHLQSTRKVSSSTSESVETQNFCVSHSEWAPRGPIWSLLTWWMRTVQSLTSSSSSPPKQPTLFKNKALTNQRFAPLGTEKCLSSQESEGGISAEEGLCLADCRVCTTEGLKSWHWLGKLPGWVILLSKVFLKIKYFFVCVYCEKQMSELETKQLDMEISGFWCVGTEFSTTQN